MERTRTSTAGKLPLATGSRRRQDLLELLDRMNPSIEALTAAVEQEAKNGPRSSAADDPSWRGIDHGTGFRADHRNSRAVSVRQADRQLCGADPSEDSSAGTATARHISKQGNALLRYLLGEAAQAAVRCDSTGDVGTCTWRCVEKKTLPKWPWPGGIAVRLLDVANVGSMRSPVKFRFRTRDSSLPDMA